MKTDDGIHRLYEALRPYSSFEWDSAEDRLLSHNNASLYVQLPSALAKGTFAHVNLVSPYTDIRTPEEGIGRLRLFTQQRDYLRERGYQPWERFGVYEDGVEYVYNIPTESLEDLTRILHDLSECGTSSKNGDQQ